MLPPLLAKIITFKITWYHIVAETKTETETNPELQTETMTKTEHIHIQY